MADDRYSYNRQLAYDLLKQEGYTDIGDSAEELFKDRGNSELAYQLLSKAGYTDIGKDYNEFAGMLYGPEQEAAKPRPQSRASRFNEMARQRDEARNVNRPAMSQREVAAFEDKQAADMRARQQRMAERRAQAQKPAEEVAEETPEQVEEEPVRSNEEMLAEIASLHEQYDPIISEYERRFNEHKNTLDVGSRKNKENQDWLYAHRDEYRAAKKAVDEAQGRLNLATKEEDMERLAEKRKENRAGMPTPQEVVAGRLTPFSRNEKYQDNPERQAAEELYGMAEQALKQGSKYAPGYEGNALEKIWTAASQFVGGAANNFDKGSLTFGASEGFALKTAREVGEKNNRIVEDTIKSLGYDDEKVDSILKTRDEDVRRLNELTSDLDRESGEIESMQRTYEDMVRRGDPKAASYGKEYKKKVADYNKRIKDEYQPLFDKYQEDSKEYDTIMSAVGTAVDEGLTDGEKAVLDALEEFTLAKIKRSGDVSVASAAGAGAEQSAEFMLDFILTGGMAKAGTKAAAKLASKNILKRAVGEKGAKIVARGLSDMGVAAARTSVMVPRNLSAYGEQLVQMTGGVDDLGRYQFDRTRLNAALNTALTQYIEYWSEGFGEYFGALEQQAFKRVTNAAPRTAIGKTLSQYRGSIGQYLDKGKFDGMFNEMLEEVVGSGLNALSGWMSNDRVGDKEALKEFASGEQLATLAFSFLPMSVISARTNIKAYNKMKERYDEGVRFLNPFLRSGAIDRQDLDDLVAGISELTPEEIKDAVVVIADKARAANGGRLPDDFTTSLMGYLEGEFAMSLKNDVWENSAENMDVVNSYTQSYYNANPANAYDLAQEEKSAYDSAVEAGFSEDELELDSYMLAQQAASMKEAEPERAQVLMDYATAKAAAGGLKDGYDRETTEIIKKADEPVLANAYNNGWLITARTSDGSEVFVTSKDATVDANGNLTSPTGQDGLVSFMREDGQMDSAKAKDLADAVSQPIDQYLYERGIEIKAERDAIYEQALSTVSPLGQSRNLAQLKGQNVFVTGSGAYEPVRVERLTNNGQSVVISGDKEALKGIATAAGINSPGGTYLEIPVQSLYPMLAKDDDGALSTDMEIPEATASTQMPESAPQSPAGVEDLVGAETSIVMNGQPTDVFVTEVSDGRVFFDVEDAEGNASHFDMPVAEFERAMNGEEAPAAEPEPEPAPAPAEEPAPEAVPQNGTIPVNPETGKKNYDDPSVTPEMAYEDLYGNVEEGSKAEENRDKWVIRKSEEADKAVKDAEKLVASGEAKKKAIDNWDIKDNEDLEDLEARQNKAKEKVDAEIGSTQAELPELRRRAAFWNELKEVADENARRRERQAVRQRLIEQYGVDTSGFDLEPRSMEELLARELSDFFRSGQRLSRESVLDLVGHNMVKDLRKGGYAFVLSNDGVPVDKFVMDVDASYPGFIKDEQDAINAVGDLIMGHTRGELADYIFNNRLEEARRLMAEMENEEARAQGTEAPAFPETPAEEPQAPAEEPVAEENVEDLPEDMPEETAEPEPVAEEAVEEQPETENPAETPAPKTERNGAEKPKTPSESPEKPISSPEKGVRIPATAGEIRNVAEARAFFENQYGKGRRADNSVRVWELTHKQTTPVKNEDDGGLSNMAMSLATEGGISEEEAAELITLGTQLAEDFIVEDGYVKFPQFFKNLVETFGDNIRPFSKSIYLGASANVSDDLADQMDDRKTVRAFDTSVDLNDIEDEQEDDAGLREGEGGVSEPVAGADGEGSQEESVGNDGEPESENSSDDSGEGGNEVGTLDFGDDTESDSGSDRPGTDVAPGGAGRGRRTSNDGGSTGRGTRRNREPGQGGSRGNKGRGLHTDVGEPGGHGNVETEAEKEAKAKAAEEAAYEAEKSRIKDETDTKKLKAQLEELKVKLTGITDVFDIERAKMSGVLRAVRERLQEIFSNNANKSEALSQEKVPYSPVSDPSGEHAIGSVVPSGVADYMTDAIKRLEAEVGKPVAEYVQEELGYKSLDEMYSNLPKGKFDGLAAEQVDAVGLAIHQMKTGRSFIVGDMTGVGKGRVGAALIRWGKLHKKKVIFCTQKPGLFSAMVGDDLVNIGSPGMLPFIMNNEAGANITDEDGNVILRHPSANVYSSLYESGKDVLPTIASGQYKGRQYDFVALTYSQIQASETEAEGDSDKVRNKNARNSKGRQRINWLKTYAKDAIIIMDEAHTAAGEGSTTGINARKLVELAQGVTFMSATYAKTPQAMALYSIKSSMNDAMITTDQLISAMDQFGIPMQEIAAAAMFKTGEMVRRERDFEGVKTNWMSPEETYSKEEMENTRALSDKTVDVINSIIDFQRRYVDPVIRKLNEPLREKAAAEMASGMTDVYTEEYASTPYSGQVSNVIGMMLFALKAKKAAEIAIEQMKRGEKPVIAVDNTLGAYIDEIEGNIESADFGAVLMKGLAFALKYQKTRKHLKLKEQPNGTYKYEEIKDDRDVEKYTSIAGLLNGGGEEAIDALEENIREYGKETLAMDLPLSPIDYIEKKIADAGFRCGEITGRSNRLVQNEDGTWRKEALKQKKAKEVVRAFNGGTKKSPLPKEETYDAVLMNRSGSTGNSMHAYAKYADQRPRKMIILQAAKDPNEEVQIRGRIDRTGQISRGEYFYLVSPIPAEKKITMMLKQKLASLDANSSGTEKVSSNRVEAEDMDNKYGDEVARDFLIEHEEIHLQMDPAKQMKKNRKTGEYMGYDGLLYNLLLSMQRMTCAEQEMILNELEEAYAQKIEYLNQNGINDLATTTMNLEATTVDEAIMVKGKDNESLSEFAHDTNIERMEVNVLRKPLRSEDIAKKIKELGGLEKHTRTTSWGTEEEVSYGDFIQQNAREAVEKLKSERRAKMDAAEEKLREDIKAEMPKNDSITEAQYEEAVDNDPRLASLRLRNMNEYARYEMQLDEQLRFMRNATTFFKPGRACLIPLNESEGAQNMYGRFLGYKAGKDGRPKSVEAVFATKDSRAMVSIPLINMHKIIDTIRTNSGGWTDIFGKSDSDYASEEARLAEYDKWWDRMIPANTSRSIRYMITGNILQAAGSLAAYRGTITTFTRKDAETGEITVDKGLLLAEDFDPENFVVRTEVTKEDVWETPGEFSDPLTNIAVFREGDRLAVKFTRERGSRKKLSDHPVMSDDEFKTLCVGNEIIPYGADELRAYVSEENAADALDYLYKNYGFTQGHLLVMPDSTEKPDRIVYTNNPYRQVIDELQPKYRGVYGSSSAQRKIDEALKTFKMDVTNEDLKEKIRELVQLRQAYIRRDYANLDDADLATQVIIAEQKADKLGKAEPNESPEQAKARKENRNQYLYLAEAFKEELGTRGYEKDGHLKHYKQGKTALDTMIEAFDEFNADEENAKIAKRVFGIMRKLNANYFFDEKASEDVGGQTRGDYVGYNWRYMNEAWVADQLKANTILHEMLHTATVYPFEAMQRAADHLVPNVIEEAKQADALFRAINQNKAFRHQIGEDSYESYTDYGVRKNAKEMLAETGSNQKFRDDLEKVKVLVRVVNSFGQTAYQFTDVTDNPNATGGKVMTALEASMDILDRMLNAFDPEAYRKVWTGTGYGEMSYREADIPEHQRIVEAELAATNRTLDSMGEALGVKINRVGRDGMPKGHKTAKGYFDPRTGEMTICMDNVTDERDAVATVLHETVGHKGLRELFGEQFNEAMVRIYAALDNKGKMWVNAYMVRHDLQPGDTDSIIRGMEEYMAHLAESGDFKRSVWDNIKEILGKIVDLLFGTDGFTFTDRELNYILRASYEHLKNPNWLNTPLGKAQDTLWKRELGINETDPNRPTDPDGPGTGILYRDGETQDNALGNYEAGLARKGTAMITENQNADLPVKIGMEAVMKEVGMTELREDMDYLQRHNLASSRADTEAHDFELFRFTPMLEQVREVQSKLVGENATNEDREDAYNEIRDYLYAVSGLERNNYKNNEIEQAKKDALANADSAFKTAVDAIENNDKLSDNDKSAEIAKLEKKLAEKKKEIEEKYEAMKKDWSGLTGLTGHVETEWREAEDEARKLIKDFKRKVGDNAALNELWNRIRACTDYSLEHAYKHGLLTRDEYEKLHGTATQPRMWNYYLPLRGFAQGTAEDVYSYSTFLNPSTNNVVTRKMKGRKTEADDPLATILNIAETEIVQGNDNWAKQALLKFVQSAGNNSLLTEKEPWYVKDTVTGKWSLGIPEDDETLEHFEARMQDLREKGEAKKGRRGLKLENIMANKAHRNEHLIHVKVGGLDKMIWVNGNPALAKAVTGFGKKQSYQWIRRASRVLSNLFTTYSLDFSVKNLIRDTLYSRVALAVKEDREYRKKFSENWWKNGGVTAAPIIKLADMWNSGELQRIPEDQRTERQQLFIDFMHDGGQTGYTIINSVNTIKRSLERSMRRAGKKIKEAEFPILGVRIPLFDDYAKLVSTLNEGFELLTRFTAYQTSRQSGRSGQRSASDAKEISVNFNRRGAQSNEGFWGHIAAFLGATHYFYNAGVQGFDNYLRLFKANTKKMSTLTAGFMVMGILTPLVNGLIASATGGGDDDWYWNIPEWVRRNNIIIGWKGTYIALPLPVEFRAPYGIGDITGSAFVWHKYANRKGGKMLPFGDLALDLLSTASNILPLNPVEGYEGSRNIGDAVLRAVAPDATMFIVDLATNRDYTGRPLWKENPFSETTPKCFGAYASTPKGIVNACQKLSELTYNRIDIAPGAVRDFMNNYGGGFFRTAEDVSKVLRPLFEDDPDRPFRWDNIPFLSGFTGHIDQDRSNSYAKDALNEYRQLSESVVAKVASQVGGKVSSSDVYDYPDAVLDMTESAFRRARIQKILNSKDYELGKMYREGMNNEYEMKQYVRGEKAGQWYKSRTVKREGVDALKNKWLKLRDEWAQMPSKTAEEKSAKALVQADVENAWHVYYDAEANLADELMKKEYGK